MLNAMSLLQAVGFDAGILWVVVRNYRRTRNAGFLFLGAGLVAWPIIALLLGLTDSAMAYRLTRFQPSTSLLYWLFPAGSLTPAELLVLMQNVYSAIKASLVLIGLVLVGRAAVALQAAAPVAS